MNLLNFFDELSAKIKNMEEEIFDDIFKIINEALENLDKEKDKKVE